MDIIQSFYDNMASSYDKLFYNWWETTAEQAEMLDKIFTAEGFDRGASVLDCACGIGTQAIGLAGIGYTVTASDISRSELEEAKARAQKRNVEISFVNADFCKLSKAFTQKFDIIIAMDNALPHMLSKERLEEAVNSITGQLAQGGIFVASIRDYDALLLDKPPYSPPYIHKTPTGQRVAFQTWNWEGENYRLVQYIIEDNENLGISKFECEYRAVRREELTKLLMAGGCKSVEWKFSEQTGFYQPVMVAGK